MKTAYNFGAIFLTTLAVSLTSARAEDVATSFASTPETQAYILTTANGAGCDCKFKSGKLECGGCQKAGCVARLKTVAERDLHSSEDGLSFFYRTGMTSTPLADLNLGSCKGKALEQWVQDSDGLSKPRVTRAKDVLDCWGFLASKLKQLARPEQAQCDALAAPEYQTLRFARQATRACCIPREPGKKQTPGYLELEKKCLEPRFQVVDRAMGELQSRISGIQARWAPAAVLAYACRDNAQVHEAANAGLVRVESEFGEKFYGPAMKSWSAARAIPADLKLTKNGMPEGVPDLPDLSKTMTAREAAEAALAPSTNTGVRIGLDCAGPGCGTPVATKNHSPDLVVEEVDACVVKSLRATADKCPNCAVKVDSSCDQLGAIMSLLGSDNGIAASYLAEAVPSPDKNSRPVARAWDYRRLRIKNYFGHLREEFVGDLMKSSRLYLREKGIEPDSKSSCKAYKEISAIISGVSAPPPVSDLSDDETLTIIQHAAELKSGLLLHELYQMQTIQGQPRREGGVCPLGRPYAEWRLEGDRARVNCTSAEDQARIKVADEELKGLLSSGFDPYLRAGMDESSVFAVDTKLDVSMFPMIEKVTDLLGFGADPLASYAKEMQGLSREKMAKDVRVQKVKKLLKGEGRELLRKDLRAGLETVCDGDSWRRLLDMPGIVARVKDQGCANDGLFPVIDTCARQVLANAQSRQKNVVLGGAAGCVVGGFIPVINVAVGAACIPAFLGSATHEKNEAASDRDLAVACTVMNGCALDHAIEKISKLSDAKTNQRIQVAFALFQAAGPALRSGKVFVANVRGLKGFEKLTPAAQASIETLGEALTKASASQKAKPFEISIEDFIKQDGTYERGFDQTAQKAAEAVKAGRFVDLTGLPRRWISRTMSGGLKDAFLFESPAGSPQVFPSSENIPKELWGKSIDGWFVKIEKPGALNFPGHPEYFQYFTDGEAAMDKALPQILPPRWKMQSVIKVKVPDGPELVFQRIAPGREPVVVAEEIFGPVLKTSTHSKSDAIKDLIVKISNPDTAPCFRGVKLVGCEKAFASLIESGVDPKKIEALLSSDKKAGNFASLLEEMAAKVEHEGNALAEDRASPLNEVFMKKVLLSRQSRLYWSAEFDEIAHRPDLNLRNFHVNAVGDNFEAYVFDWF